MRWMPRVLAALMMVVAWVSPVRALSPADWVRLQKAGAGPGVIEALVQEKAVETGAVSIGDVLALKAGGVTDETLCLVIRAGSFIRDRKPRVYGSRIRSVHLATIGDLLELKAAGLDEQTLQAVILSGDADTESLRRQKAMAWLEKMGVRMDMRPTQP